MATKAKLPETERRWLRELGTLNEAQARVFVAQRALQEGRGAVSRLARLTSMSRPTILRGMAELEAGCLPSRPESGRIRTQGGGRKRIEEGWWQLLGPANQPSDRAPNTSGDANQNSTDYRWQSLHSPTPTLP